MTKAAFIKIHLTPKLELSAVQVCTHFFETLGTCNEQQHFKDITTGYNSTEKQEYWGINITKHTWNWDAEHYKTLKKENKEGHNTWRDVPYS